MGTSQLIVMKIRNELIREIETPGMSTDEANFFSLFYRTTSHSSPIKDIQITQINSIMIFCSRSHEHLPLKTVNFDKSSVHGSL